jgi:hypothetical protein
MGLERNPESPYPNVRSPPNWTLGPAQDLCGVKFDPLATWPRDLLRLTSLEFQVQSAKVQYVLAAGKQNLPGRKNPHQQSVHSRNLTGVKHFRFCSRNETLDDSDQECTVAIVRRPTHVINLKRTCLKASHTAPTPLVARQKMLKNIV